MNPYSIDDLRKIQENFTKELIDSQNGTKTSFAYIKNQIPHTSLVQKDEVFQVLVVGGSVFKCALVKKDHADGYILLNRYEKAQPPFTSEAAFLDFVLKEIDPSASKIALNFAYPIEPFFRETYLDGRLIYGSKENTFEGMQGKLVGESIEKYIKEKTGRSIIVSVANDTVCLVLSGLTEFSSSTIAGGIVGTGMNFAIMLPDKSVINLEAAGFDKFHQTESGKLIDETSIAPGTALLEKETSGAYLFKHFNYHARRMGLDIPEITSTFELDELSQSYNPQISQLANQVLVTSASLVACVVGGITMFQKCDMVFIMEGSLFWMANRYKETVKDTIIKLVPNYSVTFGKVEDSPIFGGAKLLG